MRRRVILLLTVMTATLAMVASPAWATTFTVNSTADTGDDTPDGTCESCTLREAIEEANANNDATVVDEIKFNIPGDGPHTISPGTTNLPDITEPAIIDGYTQPGASKNTLAVGNNADLRIILDGNYPQNTLAGLRFLADDSVVRGLSITRFATALVILGTDNNKIEGNFIGTDVTGIVTDPDGIPNNGDELGSPNSIFLEDGSNNTVGGTSPGARNIVSGNGFGVNIGGAASTGNKVQGNYIGTTKSGTGDLGNEHWGVIISNGASGNTIGDDKPSDGLTNAANTIAFNGNNGVGIFDAISTGNRILGNSIFSNANLGIDLDGDGVTANDPPANMDSDTGANNLQNFPVITSAKTTKRATIIKGTLNSTANTTFTLQFFGSPEADPSGNGEGQKFRFQKSVTTDPSGNATFSFKTRKKIPIGQFVTATATNKTTGATSEFSKACQVPAEPCL